MMKKNTKFIILFLLVLALPLSFCKGKSTAQSTPGPHLTVEQESFDVGTLSQASGKVVITTTVSNSGTMDLKIGQLETSCDCTTATITATTLKPGEQAALQIIYDFRSETNLKPGIFLRTVQINSNDPDRGQVVLFIEGTIE